LLDCLFELLVVGGSNGWCGHLHCSIFFAVVVDVDVDVDDDLDVDVDAVILYWSVVVLVFVYNIDNVGFHLCI